MHIPYILVLSIHAYIYLKQNVTLHFSVPTVSVLVLILSKLIIEMGFQH